MAQEAADVAHDFGATLRSLRTRAGHTQEALAQETGLSIEGISALERGHRLNPRRSTVELLATGLGLNEHGRAQLHELARRGHDKAARGSKRVAAPNPPSPGVGERQWVVPDQLPVPARSLVGREKFVEDIAAKVRAGVRTVALSGMGGLGKTAVAVAAAHELADNFGGGRVFLDMRGGHPEAAVSVDEALAFIVGSLIVENEPLPEGHAALVAQYRSLTALRRVLIVLDDIAPGLSIEELVPAGDCALLVTGRAMPPAEVESAHLALPVLSAQDGKQLLANIVGGERLSAEEAATESLLRSCAGLPLALKIIGARLQRRPAWPVGFLADRVSADDDRLSELQIGDLAVRRCVETTVEYLDSGTDQKADVRSDAAKLFVRIGLLHRPTVSVLTAAALADLPAARARRALERLADISLLDCVGPDQFTIHDLVHDHARECAARLGEQEAKAARARCVAAYTAVGWIARSQVRPSHPEQSITEPEPHLGLSGMSAAEALALISRDVDNLRATIDACLGSPDPGEQRSGVLLAISFSAYCMTRSLAFDWSRHLELALESTACVDPQLRASVLLDLASALSGRGLNKASLDASQAADAIGRELRSPVLRAAAALGSSLALHRVASDRAKERCEQALQLAIDAGDGFLEASALRDLGLILFGEGNHEAGLDAQTRSLALYEQIGNRRGRCMALINVGVMLRETGEMERSHELLKESVEEARACGDPELETEALEELGSWYRAAGDLDRCLELLEEGLALVDARGTRQWEAGLRARIALALRAMGSDDAADAQWDLAIDICHSRGEASAAEYLERQRRDPSLAPAARTSAATHST